MATKAYIVLALCAFANGATIWRPLLDGRIVGGEDADIKDLPYQLAVERNGFQFCGAAIISDEWVLTAAHCIDGSTTDGLGVRAGSSILEEGGTVYPIEQIIPHEKYNPRSIDYDFALLRVRTKFSFGIGVQPIKLTDNEPAVGANCIVSGWGDLSTGGEVPRQLQVVSVPIVSRAKCNAALGGITTRMICAGFDAGSKDSCQGDSGGPLVVNGELAGVVSFGGDCGAPGIPGVYSNIANQRDWIRENSGI